MDHWDELRMLLAVAEGGTVRPAADALDVNHAAIIRNIGRLENRLGAKLFEKPSTGYELTDAGADAVDPARQMSTASSQLEAWIFGRDQSASGPLRLTLPVSFAADLLMPTLATFRPAYPDIALEIIGSGAVANLGNREADVAWHAARRIPYWLLPASQPVGGRLPAAAWLLGADETVPAAWHPKGGLRTAPTPTDLCLVACPIWDTVGAEATGCFAGLVERPGKATLHVEGVPFPNIVASDLQILATEIVRSGGAVRIR